MWFFQSAIDAAMKMVRVCGHCGTKTFAKLSQKDEDIRCPRCKRLVPPPGKKKKIAKDYDNDNPW